MLKIENFINIEGEEFQLGNGQKYMTGIAKNMGDNYSFGVFEFDEKNRANITGAIVFELSKQIFSDGAPYYSLSSSQMNHPLKVRPQNLTLRNFVLELHMATGRIKHKW